MRTEIIPFQHAHLPGAALLLAKRHQRNRVAESVLPARFEDIAVTSVTLETIWNKPGARGVVALHNRCIVATLSLYQRSKLLGAVLCGSDWRVMPSILTMKQNSTVIFMRRLLLTGWRQATSIIIFWFQQRTVLLWTLGSH